MSDEKTFTMTYIHQLINYNVMRMSNKRNEIAVETEWKPDIFWFLAVMMLIIMASIAFFGWHNIKGIHLMQSSDYRTTVGTIESSQMNRCGKANRSFCFDIIYTFNVDSVRYRSDIVNFFGHRSDDRSFVEKYVHKYPAGKRVVVYYENNNPSFAVLEPNTKGTSTLFSPLLPIAVSVLLAIAFAFIAVYLTGKQKFSLKSAVNRESPQT